MPEHSLSGTHFVRVLRSALQSAKRFWPRVGDRMEVRRNALKLRWWGTRHIPEENLFDLSYEIIKSMPNSGVYELRIDDEIGGLRNLRVVFLEPPAQWVSAVEMPLPVLWVLEALPKKRNDWTSYDIDRFKAKRALVKERFYSG